MLGQVHFSQVQSQIRRKNQLDKICSKLQLSIKDIDNKQQLPKSISSKIQQYIQNDDICKLQNFLNKKVIGYQAQIGIKSMKWNIIHFCAKNNSKNILQYILPKKYQQNQQEYKQLVNSKTSQGYTPLMISIIYNSKDSLQIFLKFGGIIIQQTDNRNMTAYQIALNYKNQNAIKLLMQYEKVKKKSNKNDLLFINQKQLSKPINFQGQNSNIYNKVFQYIIDCFICFKDINQDQIQQIKIKQFNFQNKNKSILKKNNNNNKLLGLINYNENKNIQFDIVEIGNTLILQKFQIQWRRVASHTNQKNVLYDCFQPFDIHQNNLIIANNLIIFQCLSDHTWLLRKILKPCKNVTQSQEKAKYNLQIYMNEQVKKIIIDDKIPFLKQREQPLFLSNSNQFWPQILQKGLAKAYGSYMKLTQIQPLNFLYSLTGSFTKRFFLKPKFNYLCLQNQQPINQKSILLALQDFNQKGYMILLEGREGTSLVPNNTPNLFKNYHYTVLNYYEKSNKRLILVNCPYVLNSWKQKQKKQGMQLKLIKSHYNTHNQMCVWIDQSQFAHYFKSVIISFIEPNMNRTQLKMKFLIENKIKNVQSIKKRQSQPGSFFQNITKSLKNIIQNKQKKSQKNIEIQQQKKQQILKVIFFKFNVYQSKNSQYFTIAIKDSKNNSFCKIKSVKGWINGGVNQLFVQINKFFPDLIRIQQKKGEYFCMVQIIINQNIRGLKNNVNQSQQQKNKSSSEEIQHIQKNKVKKHQLLIICWSQDSIQMQQIQEQFATLEWIQSWKRNTIKNWTFIKKIPFPIKNQIMYTREKIGDKLIILAKSLKNLQLSIQILQKIQNTNLIIQGLRKKSQQIQMDSQFTQCSKKQRLTVQFIQDLQFQGFQYIILSFNENILDKLQSEQFKIDEKN